MSMKMQYCFKPGMFVSRPDPTAFDLCLVCPFLCTHIKDCAVDVCNLSPYKDAIIVKKNYGPRVMSGRSPSLLTLGRN